MLKNNIYEVEINKYRHINWRNSNIKTYMYIINESSSVVLCDNVKYIDIILFNIIYIILVD